MQSLVYLLKQPRAKVTGSDIFATPFSCAALCNLSLKYMYSIQIANRKRSLIAILTAKIKINTRVHYYILYFLIFPNKNDLCSVSACTAS